MRQTIISLWMEMTFAVAARVCVWGNLYEGTGIVHADGVREQEEALVETIKEMRRRRDGGGGE